MQFQVPQFIEVEDKIFGPLTFKQFVYVAGGAGMAYLIWRVLPFYLAVPFIAGAGGLAAALAFLQFNGRPFIVALEHGFFYLIHAKLYLWSNELDKGQRAKDKKADEDKRLLTSQVYIPKLSESKLHELAWSLDIKERIAAGVASDRDRSGGGVDPELFARIKTARAAKI